MVAFCTLILACALLPQTPLPAAVPVSRLELLALQTGYAYGDWLTKIISERGVDFEPTQEFMQALAAAGADERVINALKNAQRRSPPEIADPNWQEKEADAVSHFVLGIYLNRNNFHPEDAEPEFRAAVKAYPQNPFTHLALGEILTKQRRPDSWKAAAEEFKAALAISPNLAEAHFGLGNALIDSSKTKAAIDEYRDGVRLEPGNAEGHRSLGTALEIAGQKKESEKEKQIALQLGGELPRPKRIRLGGKVMGDRLLHVVTPEYPLAATLRGIQGVAKFDILVGPDGRVKDVKLISGDPELVKPAADAIYQWTYKPVLLAGTPVEVIAEVEVNFHLQ